jgi:thiol-disulfide isomerase/thioredoxin
MQTRIFFLIAAAAFGLIAFFHARQPVEARGFDDGMAPPWTLKDLDGKTVRSSEFKDKVVILDFWATWCPPCRKGIPDFIELQKQYGEKGLVIVGVSLDEAGPALVKRFANQFGINYPIVMGDTGIVNAYGGIRSIPTTFVIDRTGRVVSRHIGYTEKSVFENEIKELL